MPIHTSYTDALSRLVEFCDKASGGEIVIVRRRRKKNVAIIAADELSSLLETVHLYASPTNAHRFLHSLEELEAGKGITMTVEELRKSVGLIR